MFSNVFGRLELVSRGSRQLADPEERRDGVDAIEPRPLKVRHKAFCTGFSRFSSLVILFTPLFAWISSLFLVFWSSRPCCRTRLWSSSALRARRRSSVSSRVAGSLREARRMAPWARTPPGPPGPMAEVEVPRLRVPTCSAKRKSTRANSPPGASREDACGAPKSLRNMMKTIQNQSILGP